MEPGPKIAVVIAVRSTYKKSMRGVWKYHRLWIHTDRNLDTVPDVHPLIGMIIVEMPQTVSREGYMALFTYRKEVAIVVLDHELGHRMIDVCLAANAAVGTWDTVKGYGFGDLTYEMFLHLGSMTIALLRPHIMRTSTTRMGEHYYRLPCLWVYLTWHSDLSMTQPRPPSDITWDTRVQG